MSAIQDFLTFVIEFIAMFSFLAMVVDYIVRPYDTTLPMQPRLKTDCCQSICCDASFTKAGVDPQPQIATLDWLLSQITLVDEITDARDKDVIELAKVRAISLVKPPRLDYAAMTVQELRSLARGKVKGFMRMKKAQLIEALAATA
ncbi:hypothetical protein [Gloeocapsopsis sp. IPPAS B-1203]|uniref:hypothetical protein n=1 Tax=Gloeocapsopsis sp. IPPAS B-1203 TaxID=2049454 RepID=UPI000C17552A|nr:hypothetical protein [Gloeocapsopsis sp. IPPAS B-1203]PIG91668.1 hypothetical protein CSQ79_20230 [Gloeocapsopsis sp. IPPAS B-1203]